MGPHLAHVHEDPVGTIGVPSHPAFEKCRILANSTLGGVECLWLLAVPMASAWWHCWALPFQNGDEPVGPHGRKVVPPGREGDRERSSVAAKFGSMLYLF